MEVDSCFDVVSCYTLSVEHPLEKFILGALRRNRSCSFHVVIIECMVMYFYIIDWKWKEKEKVKEKESMKRIPSLASIRLGPRFIVWREYLMYLGTGAHFNETIQVWMLLIDIVLELAVRSGFSRSKLFIPAPVVHSLVMFDVPCFVWTGCSNFFAVLVVVVDFLRICPVLFFGWWGFICLPCKWMY